MKNFLKFLGVIALAAIIGFSMAACSSSSDGDRDDGSAKSITITGITGYEDHTGAFIGIADKEGEEVAMGMGSVKGGSATVDLIKISDGTPWTGSGSYLIYLSLNEDEFLYTDGKSIAQMGISSPPTEDDIKKTPTYNISSASSSIPFDKFLKIPDEWK